eukprot:TRINITY_DN895_c6_g1_i1.p1 TRINITY_DN895_c6_g1~~TRINITY_DN895_c6_g1_i1.p1  ORF type:complete len:356 (+),score=39.73 TRINITY_DN895_c6_g1_i1:80-1069(+)
MLTRSILLMTMAGMATAADSMSFLAIGDWGGMGDGHPTSPGEVDNNKGMGSVAETLGDMQFVLALGDNFYFEGIQGDVTSDRFDSTFENVFTSPNLQVPWYVCAGNHDHYGNVTAEIEYTKFSKRWTFPSLWYTFSEQFTTPAGKTVTTQVIYIDTYTFSGMSFHDHDTHEFIQGKGPPDVKLAGQQLQWLEQEMAKSTADYLWVAGHYPIYSQCSHGPTAELVQDVLPLLTKYNASGYLSGHDHCLGHFEVDNKALVLSGAGMECCYRPTHEKDVPAGAMKFHMDASQTFGADGGFASLTATENTTTIKYYDSHGKVLFTANPVHPRR